MRGEAVDAGEVRVQAVGELLGVGAADALDQLDAGVAGFVVRGREPGVVACQLRHGVAMKLGGFGVGEHQPVLRCAARQLDVGAFAVEAVGADADGQVPGAALGPVGGQRVGMSEVPTPAQVPVGEHQLGTAIQTDGERAGVDGGDVAGLPVGDVDRVAVDGVLGAVAPHDDPFTDPEHTRPEPHAGAVELAGIGEASDDGLVEPLDEVVGAGQQHRRQADVAGGEPAVDGGGDHRLRGVGDDDAPVGEVGLDSVGDRPVTQVGQGGLLPRLALAAVDAQLGHTAGLHGGGGEPAPGTDLGQLVVITRQQHPAPGAKLAGDDRLEGAHVGHPRLVHHQQ